MSVGTVVRFDRRRGYGFVSPEDGGEDVFVHQNNITMEGFRYLQIGEKVNYELEVGEKGMKAVSVTLVEPRQERPRGEGEDGAYGDDQRDDRDNPRPRFEERAPRPTFERQERPARPARESHSNGDSQGAEQLDKLRRKQERLISLLVEKGILAPGEIDGLDAAVNAATAQG